MHTHNIASWVHPHDFDAVDMGNERRIAAVAALTAVTMVVQPCREETGEMKSDNGPASACHTIAQKPRRG